MTMVSYGARIFNENFNKDISFFIDQSVLSIISDIKAIKDIFHNYNEFTTLKDITNIDGKLVINLLNEIKYLLNYRDVYILEEKYKDLIKKKGINFQRIDSLNVDYKIYEEAIKIVSNKFISSINVDDILIFDFRLDEKYYIKDNEKVMLTNNEREIVININSHLQKIANIFKEVLPGINIKTIDSGLYIRDTQMRTIEFEETLMEDITNIIKEFKVIKKSFINEKIHNSNLGIRYYFKKAIFNNKDKLIIVFSAFSNDKPKYNYINTLSTYDCNKLYILDNYGSKGTYYLGLNGDLEIETAVMSLISKIVSENNINFKNIISIGSSKGGTAALYYGMKYNFGNIIVGSPQYKIGTYLCDLSIKTYADEIFGDRSIANRIKYDNLIRLICNNKSKIYLLTSDGDNQYDRVLKSFEYVSEELNLNLKIDKCDIKNHNDIAKEFPKYLEDKLSKILRDNKYKRLIIKRFIEIFKLKFK
ncbi:accessory Sec system protein Asp2 [Clostridium nigeriense]|uniref:accessory Sec system protein Asp2 n=1 Tax=Clostridium nigeriense TaxID=1805470 RepID=UPI003D32DE12